MNPSEKTKTNTKKNIYIYIYGSIKNEELQS
jgi:hypothetical protein